MDGTSTETDLDNLGTVLTRTATDILFGVVNSRDTYGSPDELDRMSVVTHLNGLSEQTHYACCGLDNTIDLDGVTTQYYYDNLKRLVSTNRSTPGSLIFTTNILDAAGNLLVTQRVGEDAVAKTLYQAMYDNAGYKTKETNAWNGVTVFSESLDPNSRQLTKTVNHPDNGTRTELYGTDGSLQKVTGNATFPMRYEYGVENSGLLDANNNPLCLLYSREIKLDAGNNDTGEWTKTYTDLLGRVCKTLYPDGAYRQSFFNAKGQLFKERDEDGLLTYRQYDNQGRLFAVVNALSPVADENNPFSYGGNNRTTYYNYSRYSLYNIDWQDTSTYVITDDGSGQPVHRTMTSLNAAQQELVWETVFPQGYSETTVKSTTAYNQANQQRTVTVTAPDGSKTVSTYSYGRLISVTKQDVNGVPLTQVSYDYDPQGRVWHVNDLRTGTTSYLYNDADQAKSVTTPTPGGPGQNPQVTSTYYDQLGRATGTQEPDQTTTTNLYFATSLLQQASGSRTYPVSYTYDPQGRLQTMTTSGNSGPATTTWTYDAQRGWLTGKSCQVGGGPTYGYTPGGRLQWRISARGIVLTNTYGFQDGHPNDKHGDVVAITYSNEPQSTPGVGLSYDRLGRVKTVTRNNITSTLSYNYANQLLGEAYSGAGTLGGLSVAAAYDSYLRRSSLDTSNGGTLTHQTFTYDSVTGRFQTATDGNTAAYSYVANSPLVGQININAGRMVTTKQYDNINRLTSISTAASGGATVSAGYAYNDANQRTRLNLADGSYWVYTYDTLGQVTSGKRYWSDGTAVPGQQLVYTEDSIGNRTQTGVGGDQNGQNLRMANYAPNSLNQYNSRQVSTSVDVLGIGNTAASVGVTINNVAQSVYRRNEYFQAVGSAGNGGGPAWTPVSVTASRGGSTVQQPSSPPGHLLVPPVNQPFLYDADGNLTNDLVWSYTWDAENRLIAMDCLVTGPTAQHLVFEYDWLGRRIRKTVKDVNNAVISDTKFLYHGWNLIAELSPQSSILRSYLWGLDLSGSWQGAGGVGGLLAVNDAANGVHFVCYDGNGNIVALVQATDGLATTRYEYGPFGELLRATGPMAALNHRRWSTKYTDDETDLVYYGYRYYSPSLARWLSRDPSEEAAGMNLYDYVINAPTWLIDSDGRQVQLPIRLPGPTVAPPGGPTGMRGLVPLWPRPNSAPGGQSDLKVSWQSFPAELDKLGRGNEDESRGACLDLAKQINVNKYFHSLPSRGRATGAAAVLWHTQEGEIARFVPPGYLAASALRVRSVHRGHLIPREYGGKDGAENVVTQDAAYNTPYFRDLIRLKLEQLLKGPRKCNVVCLMVIPYYLPEKPVPAAFGITIVDKLNYFYHKVDVQPRVYGDLNFEPAPWHGTSGYAWLNGQLLEAGF